MRNCKAYHKYTILHEYMMITVQTWTAVFLEHLAISSFMVSFQAWTESLSGLFLWACFLLPCLIQYLAVYLSGLGFTPNAFLLSGWLLTNVQVNNITTLHDICAHMYIHYIGITILLFLLHFFHSSWQAGWSRPFLSDTHTYLQTSSIYLKLSFSAYNVYKMIL